MSPSTSVHLWGIKISCSVKVGQRKRGRASIIHYIKNSRIFKKKKTGGNLALLSLALCCMFLSVSLRTGNNTDCSAVKKDVI